MAAESRLEKRVRLDMEKSGWLMVKVGLCSKPGFPDRICIHTNRIFFIELKAKGKDASELQKYVHKELRKKGFHVFVIDTWEKYLELKKRL